MDIFNTFNDLLLPGRGRTHLRGRRDHPRRRRRDGRRRCSTSGMLGGAACRQGRCTPAQGEEHEDPYCRLPRLTTVVMTLPGCLTSHAPALIPGLEKALKDTGSNPMRIEALLFLKMHWPAPADDLPATRQGPHTASCRVGGRPLLQDSLGGAPCPLRDRSAPPPGASRLVLRVRIARPGAVRRRRAALASAGPGPGGEECAITCMGCHRVPPRRPPCRQPDDNRAPLLERMRNEITRVTTVKTFALIAGAKLDVKLATPANGGRVLQLAVTELCAFLRKSNRPLRQAWPHRARRAHRQALEFSAGCRRRYNDPGAVRPCNRCRPHVAHLALTLGKTITITKSSTMVQPLKEILLPKALTLLQSSLLQGVALRSLLQFSAASRRKAAWMRRRRLTPASSQPGVVQRGRRTARTAIPYPRSRKPSRRAAQRPSLRRRQRW